ALAGGTRPPQSQRGESMVTRTRNTPETGFSAALSAAVERMSQVGGADIIALYPYDEETDAIYAPVALGLPESDIVNALPDLADQLRRFRDDQAQGKTPEDLHPSHYGPAAWL